MIYRAYWLKPIAQALEGTVPNSIIAWHKRGHEQKVYDHYYTLDFSEEPTRRSYISKYEYAIVADLWFLKLRFSWVGREQKVPK